MDAIDSPAALPTDTGTDTDRLAALEARLVAAEATACDAREEARHAREDARRARRQVRATWAVAASGCLGAFVLGANPAARAQFGVTLSSLDTRLKGVETKTASMSALTDAFTNQPTVRFSGVNVQVVDGSGDTIGTANGRGNLIIGYNEPRALFGDFSGDVRTGSHNLVVGIRNNYSSFGGTVVGFNNSISNIYASVSGGYDNTASGQWATVSGGTSNTASGDDSSVSGGKENTASGRWASVSGGDTNTAAGEDSSVSGGRDNTASGALAGVSGGIDNTASGAFASVSGGSGNQAKADASSISGGANGVANATAAYSSISGGNGRTISSQFGWVAGSQAVGGFTSGNFSSP